MTSTVMPDIYGKVRNLLTFGGQTNYHLERLNNYKKYWNFYNGKHWSFKRTDEEPVVTMNYTRAIVNTGVNFLFGEGFEVVIPDDPATPEYDPDTRSFIKEMLEETWRRNKKELWSLKCGQQGGTTGDVFVRASWEADDVLEAPYCRFDIMPSQYCFPEYDGTDTQKMTAMLMIFPVFKSKGATGQQEVVVKAEYWTKEKVVYFEDDVEIGSEENILGEIPIVHIPNYPLSGDPYGISDLVDAVELQKSLNEVATDISDVVNYHGSPITIIEGAGVEEAEKGAGKVWSLPEGAKAYNLEMSGDLGANLEFFNMIREALFEITQTPEAVLAGAGEISNTTGVALAMQYLPLVQKRKIKILTYGYGLRLLNRLAIIITDKEDDAFHKKLKPLKGNVYRNDVLFPPALPRDEAIELDNSLKRLEGGISSRREEMKRLYGWDDKKIDTLLEQIKKERLEMEQAEFGSAGDGDVVTPKRPNPDSQSHKVSITAGQGTGDED